MNTVVLCFLMGTLMIEQTYGNVPGKLKKLFEWCPEKIEYVYENQKLLQHLLATGKFIPKNNVPLGIAIHPHKKIMFVTVPRWRAGVLSTLNWVPIGKGNLNEPLNPYPCWEANDIYGGSNYPYKIISVIRVFIDSCDRLWVIDSGYDDKMDNRTQIENPKVLIFDINKNKLLHIHRFSSSVTDAKTASLGKIVVDVTTENCDKAFAYITDVISPGLIVYDLKRDKASRIQSNYLMLEPLKSTYEVEGKTVFSNAGIDGICLSGKYTDGYRNFYASPQASNKQFITTTKFLRNESHFGSNEVLEYLGERCPNCQSGGAQVVDEKTGVMFYSDLNSNAISCWNGDHSNFGSDTQDRVAVSNQLRYVSDLVITPEREMAAISCDLRTYFYTGKVGFVGVFVGVVDSLIDGTICQYHPKVPESACCHKSQ